MPHRGAGGRELLRGALECGCHRAGALEPMRRILCERGRDHARECRRVAVVGEVRRRGVDVLLDQIEVVVGRERRRAR